MLTTRKSILYVYLSINIYIINYIYTYHIIYNGVGASLAHRCHMISLVSHPLTSVDENEMHGETYSSSEAVGASARDFFDYDVILSGGNDDDEMLGSGVGSSSAAGSSNSRRRSFDSGFLDFEDNEMLGEAVGKTSSEAFCQRAWFLDKQRRVEPFSADEVHKKTRAQTQIDKITCNVKTNNSLYKLAAMLY